MSENRFDNEYMAPFSFQLCDALFDVFMANMKEHDIQAKRIEVTSGSCVYAIGVKNSPITGTLFMRQSELEQTFIRIMPNRNNPVDKLRALQSLLGAFWAFCHALIQEDRTLPLLSSLPLPEDVVTLLTQLGPPPSRLATDPKQSRRGDSREPPKPDDPIENWLDWQEGELKRGRSPHSVSYPRLSELSGKKYSVSQFKHARQKHKRTKSEP